ncbi:response regulator [Prolixibacter sp. NT017]|uniref:response regulator n=1 Tax=Prolixibacter sp. NT017 TaxID=2652390 RepID=UPI001277BF5F|nr:response regulator [Prolixibacter sp. NT017]GET25407.1 response regulator [Prolixibacter sp. NT017]
MEIKTVLLAEDNPRDAELTLEALKENNLANDIIWVQDGEMVMNYLLKEGEFADRNPGLPAVVILDLKMPKMDGIETLAAIRSNEKLKSIPVVMLTSSQQEEDLVKSYDLGVNAYVVKPVDLADFMEAIKQLGMFWVVVNQSPKI